MTLNVMHSEWMSCVSVYHYIIFCKIYLASRDVALHLVVVVWITYIVLFDIMTVLHIFTFVGCTRSRTCRHLNYANSASKLVDN